VRGTDLEGRAALLLLEAADQLFEVAPSPNTLKRCFTGGVWAIGPPMPE
jgi:hypothetical protein